DVGLQPVATGAAGGEVGHHVAAALDLLARGELGGGVGVGGDEGGEGLTLVAVEVGGGQPVVVGLDVGLAGRVVQDHAHGPALEDVEALLDPGVDPAQAGDDLAGEDAARGRAGPLGDGGAGQGLGGPAAGQGQGGLELALLGGGGDRVHPRPAVVDGVRAGAV